MYVCSDTKENAIAGETNMLYQDKQCNKNQPKLKIKAVKYSSKKKVKKRVT